MEETEEIKIHPKKNNLLRNSLITLGVLVLVYSLISKIAYAYSFGIVGDVSAVLTPAKNLIRFGNLEFSGNEAPFRIMRDGCDINNLNCPYWFSYLAPVFFYVPFILIFGSNTVMPFLVAQICTFLAILALLFIFFRKNPILINIFLLILLSTFTLNQGFWGSATTLQYLIFMIIIFANLDYFIKKPIQLGFMIGLCYQFRPEVMFVLPALLFYILLTKPIKEFGLKNLVFNFLKIIAAALTVVAIFLIVRTSLGGDSSIDHKLYVLAVGTLAPGHGMVHGFEPHVMADLFTPEIFPRIIMKVFLRMQDLLFFWRKDHHFWFRPDMWIFVAILILAFSRRKKLKKKQYADLVFLLTIIILGISFGMLGCDSRKYYDMPCFLFFLYFFRNYRILFPSLRFHRGPKPWLFVVLFVIACGYNLLYSEAFHRESRSLKTEESKRQLGRFLERHLPMDTRMMSADRGPWTWYGRGIHNVAFDNSTYVSPEFIKRYQLEALLVELPVKPGRTRNMSYGDLKIRYKLQAANGKWYYLFIRD